MFDVYTIFHPVIGHADHVCLENAFLTYLTYEFNIIYFNLISHPFGCQVFLVK